MAMAVLAGWMITMRACKRTKIEPQQVADIAFYSVLIGILSAHIVSILLDFQIYWHDPSEILRLWRGILSPEGGLRGLSFHGGLIGGVGFALFYAHRHKLRFLDIADLFSPGLAVGYAIARIGCFFNGCCYGVPTNLPWAVRFHIDPVSSYLTVPSHPTQIYASIASLFIYWALVSIRKRQRYSGQVFLSYLTLYSVYRFLIEFLRSGVTAKVLFAGLTEAQFASMAILIVTCSLLWSMRNKAIAQV